MDPTPELGLPDPSLAHRSRLLRTSAVAAVANVVLLVIAVADTIVVARLLGAGGKGSLFLFTTIVSLVGLILSCSLGQALQVAVTQGRLGAGAATRFCVRWVMTAAVPLVVAAVVLRDTEVFAGLAVIGALLVPADALLAMVMPLFVAVDRVGRRSMMDVGGAVLDLTLTAGLILSGGDQVFRAALGIAIARWLLVVVLLHDLWGYEPALAEPGWRREAVAVGLRQHPGGLINRAAKRFDSFLLAGFLGSRAVGVYSVATMLAEVPLLAVRAVQPSIISFAAALGDGGAKDVARAARAVLLGYAVGLVPYALVTTLLIGPVLGEGFDGAAWPLVLLLVSTLLLAHYSVLAGYFLGMRRPGVVSWTMAVPLAVNVVLSLLLIPSHRLVGDAFASLAGSALAATAGAVIFARMTKQEISASVVPTVNDARVVQTTARRFVAGLRPRAGRQ